MHEANQNASEKQGLFPCEALPEAGAETFQFRCGGTGRLSGWCSDNDMTMTHSAKVIQPKSATWPCGLERWRHDPMKKESVTNLKACANCVLRVLLVNSTMMHTGSKKRMQACLI